MDSDSNKEYKSKIITIFGTKYEIKHKNINVINNKYSIYFGLIIHSFTKKLLIILVSCLIIYIMIWQHINSIILECLNDNNLCKYDNINCTDLLYDEKYQCIKNTNLINLIYSSIIDLSYNILYLFFIILLLYILVIVCEKITLLINISISKYNEHIPNIENRI
jgi:hypothetical protein